jgi:hypothetical protein
VTESGSGARFIRADLHVHSFPDDGSPAAAPKDYITEARSQDISVLGITDHNSIANVRSFIEAASGQLLVLPGIEVTTHQGHLLALFGPDRLDALQAFATRENLKLTDDKASKATRSSRSILDLVGDIYDRGGLAIPAHIDTSDGITTKLAETELIELLCHPGLAGLEYSFEDNLGWFTSTDADSSRRAAWVARQKSAVADRGLATLMSSDAHAPGQVGRDRARRTLTRLRIDDLNFTAVRNAILLNPKARCKPEAVLPPTYPHVQRVEFVGGFLDGVTFNLSPNLNCLIGGRGSGKSTALIALRAALGATVDEDDPDLPERMPDQTIVEFMDELGSVRRATRVRGSAPIDQLTAAPTALTIADLGQDESGRLARGYTDSPELLLQFLDQFCDLRVHADRESELIDELADNARAVKESNPDAKHEKALRDELAKLEGSLGAAEKGNIERLAKLAILLSSHGPMIDSLDELVDRATSKPVPVSIDLDALAQRTGADLKERPAIDFVEGDDGLRARVGSLAASAIEIGKSYVESMREAAKPARERIEEWRRRHSLWETQLKERRAELEKLGLKVQAGELERLAKRREVVRKELGRIDERRKVHQATLKQRKTLLDTLRAERDARYERRRATLKRIEDSANAASRGLQISVVYERAASLEDWAAWLGGNFLFRSPRVERLAAALSPERLADLMLTVGKAGLVAFEAGGEHFFDNALLADRWQSVFTWDVIFELETMLVEDRAKIVVREPGSSKFKEFDELSAGQQRSVLLSLLLCAERSQPMILDQPEDHLDAEYIASAVVGHLEQAKERRQVIIATHSANLTVLGDAELVIPMVSDGKRGSVADAGAVDRDVTRERVCDLLEGGEQAFTRRGERYGLRVTRQ